MTQESLGQPRGLSAEDNVRLNSAVFVLDLSPEERAIELAAMREKYDGNSRALQMIDKYDPTSEFGKLRTKFIRALRAGKNRKAGRIEREIKKRFPDY